MVPSTFSEKSQEHITDCFCRAPPTALTPETRYDKVMEAFGGKGHLVRTPEELCKGFKDAMEDEDGAYLFNILIDPVATRKTQVCSFPLFHFVYYWLRKITNQEVAFFFCNL